MNKKAILVVSFGTSYANSCARAIDKIEQEIQNAYPDYIVYRAWTSGMIRKKLEKRDGIHIFSVEEALLKMREDGISRIIVQPTHIINGIRKLFLEHLKEGLEKQSQEA